MATPRSTGTAVIARLRVAAERIGLPAWFVMIDLLWIAKPAVLGIDARHYQRASSTWLAGGDPWKVAEGGITFAAGPHTLLFYIPTSFLPLDLSTAVWMALGLAASVWLVRHLGLPYWWVAFPPLTHAIWNGNPQTIVLALLVLGGSLPAAAAVALKLYAGLALLTRPRALLVTVTVLAVTLPLLPWQLYIQDGFGVTGHLQTAWNGSAWRLPILILPTLLGLWILRRDGAEWLIVPAVWPATVFYYISMALPVAARRPLVAAALAAPVPLMTPLVVMVMAARKVWLGRRPAASAVQPAAPAGLSPG